ncbi:MAG: SRPBCC family protein [Sphingomonas sp.]
MIRTVMLAPLLLAVPAAAEVVATAPAGFEVKETATIAAAPDKIWPVLLAPQHWWSKDHTWSGDAANLYMDHQATGCFCEKLPNKGSVEHARIVFLAPGKTLRLRGAFGPLQGEAVVGTLTIDLAPDGDNATKVTFDYVVGGYIRAGAENIAPAVDGVLGAQLVGLKAAVEAGVPAG